MNTMHKPPLKPRKLYVYRRFSVTDGYVMEFNAVTVLTVVKQCDTMNTLKKYFGHNRRNMLTKAKLCDTMYIRR